MADNGRIDEGEAGELDEGRGQEDEDKTEKGAHSQGREDQVNSVWRDAASGMGKMPLPVFLRQRYKIPSLTDTTTAQ